MKARPENGRYVVVAQEYASRNEMEVIRRKLRWCVGIIFSAAAAKSWHLKTRMLSMICPDW